MEKQICGIVITGGPCAGKSTGLCYPEEKLQDFGHKILMTPEAPTELMLAGIKPEKNGFSQKLFQEILFRRQLETEELFKYAAKKSRAKKMVLLYDRGLMDVRAYMEETHFLKVLKMHGFKDIPEIRDGRYGAVFHLRSAAIGAEEFYTTENNPVRFETLEEARDADERTLNAWNGHPHLRVIDNSTDFEGKMRRLLQEICACLGIPVPIERERKFLVASGFDPSSLKHHVPVQRIDIVQAYLLAKDDEEQRIRARGQNGAYVYYKTKKILLPNPEERLETERHITKEIFDELWEQKDPARHPIQKRRYCFIWKEQYFELDFFKHPYIGLCLLEIELTGEKSAVEIPNFIPIVREVTSEKEYSNRELARVGANIY